jgi:hypothetical protein
MSGGYVPLFGSLTTGTLCGRWPDVGLWPIVLSLSDKHGVVDVTLDFISKVTGLSIDDVTACMERFCDPDPNSRTAAEAGARLLLIEPTQRKWGWKVVNHRQYRERARKQAQQTDRTESGKDAERKRLERLNVPRSPAQSRADRPSDADADADANTKPRARRAGPAASAELAFHQQVVDAYHGACPHLRAITSWPTHRKAKLNARIRERCADGKPADTVDWWKRFFEYVTASDFLSGRAEPTRGKKPFKATIDWLLGAENFPKVIEGNYE